MKLSTLCLCIFGVICLPSEIGCCDSGTYYSQYLHGCLECPESPALNCEYEHRNDIRSCLLHCVTGSVSTNNPNLPRTTPSLEQQTTLAMSTLSVRKSQASNANSPTKQPTTLATLSASENETWPTTPSKQSTTLATLSSHENKTREKTPSKQPTTLATLSVRKNKTSKVSPPSNEQTTLARLSARKSKTSKTTISSKEPTISTLATRKNKTTSTATAPSRAHENETSKTTSATPLALSSALGNGTTRKAALPSKQPTIMAASSARKNKTSKAAPPSKQPTRLASLSYGEPNTNKAKNLPSKQSIRPKTSEHSRGENSEKNGNRRPYVGTIQLSHFIVLVCVLVLTTLVIVYIINTCRRQSRRPEVLNPSCAGYILVSVCANEGLAPASYDELPPGSIQLNSLNT